MLRLNTRLVAAMVAGLAVTVAAADLGEDAARQAERELYAGSWRITSIEANGNSSSDDDRVSLVENRPDGTWRLTVDGKEVSSGTSTMDPLANPKEIDIEITAGDGAGGVLRGIYEVGEKTRRLCFRGGNAWRPREFSGAAGTESVLVVFERFHERRREQARTEGGDAGRDGD